jgi:hypothetical protein
VTVTAGERIAVSLVSFLAAAMAAAYAIDRIGLTIAPLAVLIVAIAAAAGVFLLLQPRPYRDRGETLAFAAIAAAVFAYLLWLARPAFLPIGGGPDLAHHLVLVDYIERHWRLVHDPALGAVMGEMADYTPGVHLLAALAGAWTRTDGLHTIYPILAISVALKAALVFAITVRVLQPSSHARVPFAIAAAVLLFAPQEYFLRSFTEHSFLAQVVSELFAVAMWWALVAWDERPSMAATVVFAIAGVGAFLTWPVWIGPLLLAQVATMALRGDLPVRERLTAMLTAGAPIAVVAAVHAIGRAHAAAITATSGFVVWPSIEMFGVWFLVLAAIGVVASMTVVPSRSTIWLIASIALQAAALFVVATRSGADRPYLALKMVYLAIYPLAVAASLPLAVVLGWMARMGGTGGSPSRLSSLSGLLPVAVVALIVGRPLIKEPRAKPVVSQPMALAGRWARESLPAACIDYLVQDDDSAYWLHLAVLGNARQTERTRDPATFDPKAALIRWIQPAGLPYAITDDFDALPKDIRSSVDVVQRFGPAAVVKRRGRSTCAER